MTDPCKPKHTSPARRLLRCALIGVAVVIIIWAVLCYVILPALWRHYEHCPEMADTPKTTQTAAGIPGDPLNVALLGTEDEVVEAFLTAKWYPADPVTFRSGLRIAAGVLRGRPYPTAPVSSLYLWGRRQDLAFEQAVGDSPRQRHHVRFWQSPLATTDRRPLWIGAATFDRSVGLSHRTGQITHHIAPDVDAERDKVIEDLRLARRLTCVYQVTGVGSSLMGRNGGGDWYYTDGEVSVGELSAGGALAPRVPTELGSPAPVQWKNQTWSWLHGLLRGNG